MSIHSSQFQPLDYINVTNVRHLKPKNFNQNVFTAIRLVAKNIFSKVSGFPYAITVKIEKEN